MKRLTTEKRGHVFEIGLDRATKYNAFDLAMLRELAEAYTLYEDDDQLWCALLFAHGPHFTAGLDLAEVGPAVAAGEALFGGDRVDPLGLTGRIRTKPVVQVVSGHCLTIGMELAMASDIVVAAADTSFGQIEVCRGIMPFGGATLRFPAIAGWGNAMRYLLTGERFDADEARRIGLVQEVVEGRDAAVERGREIAELVARQAPLAVQASLRSSRLAVTRGEKAALDEMMDVARDLMTTDDAREGVQSFLERRDAVFRGS